MILLIDNYDSFSYNLYQLLAMQEKEIKVIRNDEMTVDEIISMRPETIIISPGPGKPRDAGIIEELIRISAGKIPILGICLGHQAIAEAYGAKVTYAARLMHGKQSLISLNNADPIFQEMPERIPVARYHSLAVSRTDLPECLEIIAEDQNGEIMALKHKQYNIYGLQFHPESIMTPAGQQVVDNYMKQLNEITC